MHPADGADRSPFSILREAQPPPDHQHEHSCQEVLTPQEDPAPVEIRDRKTEVVRVVKRLQGLLVPHLESARRLDVVLGADDFRAVLNALDAEADGLSPSPHLLCPDEVRAYLRQSIYEELLGEPSNILYATPVKADVVRYDSMPKTFWKECLSGLRRQLKLDDPGTPAC